jgi:hypothetical protein
MIFVWIFILKCSHKTHLTFVILDPHPPSTKWPTRQRAGVNIEREELSFTCLPLTAAAVHGENIKKRGRSTLGHCLSTNQHEPPRPPAVLPPAGFPLSRSFARWSKLIVYSDVHPASKSNCTIACSCVLWATHKKKRWNCGPDSVVFQYPC